LSWDFDLTGFTTALPVARGGTGLTALGTANQVLKVNAGATALEFGTAGGTYTNSVTELYTSPATFTVPTGVTAVSVCVIGGGSGGSSPSGNGGKGGTGWAYISGLTPGGTVAVTVGAGGNGSVNGGAGGGGTSSFGSYVSATGGNPTNSNGTSNYSIPSGYQLSAAGSSAYPPWTGGMGTLRTAPSPSGGSITWTAAGNFVPGAGGGLTSVNNYPGSGGTTGIVLVQY
jgi:hypothetical protein